MDIITFLIVFLAFGYTARYLYKTVQHGEVHIHECDECTAKSIFRKKK